MCSNIKSAFNFASVHEIHCYLAFPTVKILYLAFCTNIYCICKLPARRKNYLMLKAKQSAGHTNTIIETC